MIDSTSHYRDLCRARPRGASRSAPSRTSARPRCSVLAVPPRRHRARRGDPLAIAWRGDARLRHLRLGDHGPRLRRHPRGAAARKAGKALKLPVLETLAEKGGLTYMETGFDPPVYPEARKALFGNWLSTQTFTDLFHGTDEDGSRFALYEGTSGPPLRARTRHTVFSGQIYAWQRRATGGGEIVIVPDRGIFNFFKPLGGMERVKFENDPDFEKQVRSLCLSSRSRR